VWKRAVPEAIGTEPALVLLGTSLMCVRGQLLTLILALVTAYVGVFLLFPNLHIIHNYYQYANAVFLVGAAAVALHAVSTRNRLAFFALLGFVIIAQVGEFKVFYRGAMRVEYSPRNNATMEISEALKMRTKPDEVILVYGYDWSSEIAYYSERKAITVPSWWASPSGPSDVLRNIDKFTGGKPLGAIVVCARAEGPYQFSRTEEFQALLQKVTAGMFQEQKADCDVHFREKASHDQLMRVAFRVFQSYPINYETPLTPQEVQIDGRPAVMMHAPSTMEFVVPESATTVSGAFGFAKGAYTGSGQTDGAIFRILWQDGQQHIELYQRRLDPLTVPGDRGLQDFHVDLKGLSGGKLVLQVDPGSNTNWDWTVWTAIKID
jgi:hypothetical protein